MNEKINGGSMEALKAKLTSIDIKNLIAIFDIQIAIAVAIAFFLLRGLFARIILKIINKIKREKEDVKENSMYKPLRNFFALSDDKVLIIDDFMANGEAMRGLCDIVTAAGATLMGIGCAVEKGFQGGGDRLRAAGVNLKSLAIIESAEPGNIVFRDDD